MLQYAFWRDVGSGGCWSLTVACGHGVVVADASQDSWAYLIKLHLQDATGEVDAALFDKDADDFFQVRCWLERGAHVDTKVHECARQKNG